MKVLHLLNTPGLLYPIYKGTFDQKALEVSKLPHSEGVCIKLLQGY